MDAGWLSFAILLKWQTFVVGGLAIAEVGAGGAGHEKKSPTVCRGPA